MYLKNVIKCIMLNTQVVRIPLKYKSEALSILCFHGVTQYNRLSKTANFEGRHIHRDTFAENLEYILKYFNPISLDQLEGFYYRGDSLRKNSIFITFDDGFANNYHHAFPVLKRFNCPAVVFITTGYIDNKASLWVERLEYSIHNTKLKRLKISVLNNDVDLPMSTNEEKEIAYKTVLKYLKSGLSLSVIEEIVNYISRYLGFPDLKIIEGNEDYRFLTWENVREMADSGISFGAHTVSHVNLINEDIEKAEWEMKTSKAEIEKQLGKECIAFCYPFGRSGYNSKIEGLLKDAAFKFSFQLGGELNDRKTNPFLLSRIPLGWDSKKEDVLWHILRK